MGNGYQEEVLLLEIKPELSYNRKNSALIFNFQKNKNKTSTLTPLLSGVRESLCSKASKGHVSLIVL